MTNEVVVQKSFEEKMKERVRESIGDLISDEDLAKIVEQGIKSAFFTERKTVDGYGRIDKTIPPLINEIVVECVQTAVNEKVQQWFIEHEAEVAVILDGIIRDGIVKIVMRSFDSNVHSTMVTMQNSIMHMIQGIPR